jgi:hypothetical protein
MAFAWRWANLGVCLVVLGDRANETINPWMFISQTTPKQGEHILKRKQLIEWKKRVEWDQLKVERKCLEEVQQPLLVWLAYDKLLKLIGIFTWGVDIWNSASSQI